MVASNAEVELVFQQVKAWSVESRIALARLVLESLEQGTVAALPGLKGHSSDRVLGLWGLSGAVPSDEECDQILAEELERKYAL